MNRIERALVEAARVRYEQANPRRKFDDLDYISRLVRMRSESDTLQAFLRIMSKSSGFEVESQRLLTALEHERIFAENV